jgi:hypothetical protein
MQVINKIHKEKKKQKEKINSNNRALSGKRQRQGKDKRQGNKRGVKDYTEIDKTTVGAMLAPTIYRNP